LSSATVFLDHVTKSFGPHLVLRDVTLTLAPRDRVGVVAPNGTGKSTLLRIVAGLETVDAGRVRIDPPAATVGYLAQEPDRRAGECVRDFLARRTGVADATAAFERATLALTDGRDGADDDYATALDRYLALGAAEFDARIGEVCAEVGLDARLLDASMRSLSGGEAARAALAAVLLARFDVFLLDEPTNDLDFHGLDLLERVIDDWQAACMIVSHDRAFLERTIDTVVEIDDHEHTASVFHGGWLAYLEERATARRHAEEEYADYVQRRETLARRAQREQQWAHQGVQKVKKSDEKDKNIKAFRRASSEHVAARAKRTEMMIDRLDVVDKPWEGWELRFEIAAAPRSGAVVARLSDVVIERGSFRLGPIDMEIHSAERVAVVGPNGSGKTTLLGVLLGDLLPDAGDRYLGPGVVLGTLAQARNRFGDSTLLDGFVEVTGLRLNEARSLLAKFGLGAEHVLRAAASLSPGERTRAELALLMATGVNTIVLDEPTNHLDLPAIDQLEEALATFTGTLIVVSHDRRLLDALTLTRRLELQAGTITADTTV
jgi:ATPase subunit of ABC transporter with duplicated ATPase domains